jgi:predicted DNA binding protein
MILVEFGLDYPILREALERVPEMEIAWKRSDQSEGGGHRILLWAEGGDFEAFEDGAADDPTVSEFSPVVEVGPRRLYKTDLSEAGRRKSVYPLVVEQGSILRHVTATREGWEFRVTFPDKDAFGRFYDFCRSNELGCDVYRFYEERGNPDAPRFGLTDAQRETLVTAVDCGYLEIPRESSLADLGRHFDISETAASERFRRGVKRLVETTVYADAG